MEAHLNRGRAVGAAVAIARGGVGAAQFGRAVRDAEKANVARLAPEAAPRVAHLPEAEARGSVNAITVGDDGVI